MSNNGYASHTAQQVLNRAHDIRAAFKEAHDGKNLGSGQDIEIDVAALKKLHTQIRRVIGDAHRSGLVNRDEMIQSGKWIGRDVSFSTGRGGRIDMASKTDFDRDAIQREKAIRQHFDAALKHVILQAETASAGRAHREMCRVVGAWVIPTSDA